MFRTSISANPSVWRRRGGSLLPPYENLETLGRLSEEIEATRPDTVICLGDSFDDLDVSGALDDGCRDLLLRMQAGRRWVWIEGNHDPGPAGLGGEHLGELAIDGVTYRHIARPDAEAEVSGHYHPKYAVPGGGPARRCFLWDGRRCILPAFGAYTGGLSATASPLRTLLSENACAVLAGRRALIVPLPPDGDRRSSPRQRGPACRSG